MNSKSLGNCYEREFAYKLSEWLTGEKDADVCWRDVGSGSRHTVRNKQGKETSRKADIICTKLQYEPFFNLYYVDTKTYKEFNPIIINQKNIKSNDIFLQWVKTVTECPSNMIPIMPCKIRDRTTPQFIIIPETMWCQYINCMTYQISFKDNIYKFRLILQDEFFMLNDWKLLISQNSFLAK
jgi:hypothetical protein